MAEASPPFMDKTHARAQCIIATKEEKSGLKMPYERSEELANFLTAVLNHDPEQRLAAEDLLMNDEFLKTSDTRVEFEQLIRTAKKS